MYKNSHTIYGVKIITDNSNCHPFLDPLYIAPFIGDNPMEHSQNILGVPGCANPTPGPRVHDLSLYTVRSG